MSNMKRRQEIIDEVIDAAKDIIDGDLNPRTATDFPRLRHAVLDLQADINTHQGIEEDSQHIWRTK